MRVALLALAIAAPVLAQQAEFKSGVELVTVPVTVTSRDRNTYIDGLTASDFKVSENGQQQDVANVTRERLPLSLSIVVDDSGSMALGNRRELAVEAAQRVVAGLLPGDEIAIVFFGEKVDQRLAWTKIAAIAQLNWSGWNPIGKTPLNDGMRLGLDLIEKAHNTRRVVLLITDGFENSSRLSIADLVKTRQQSETAIYGFGVGSARLSELANEQPFVRHLSKPNADAVRTADRGAPGAVAPTDALPNFDYLETLVGDSGGSVRRILTLPEASMAARNMVDELRYEYLVGYTPKKPLDGKYRKLKVEVNRRGLYVRHRGGYLALPNPDGK